jgi:hypothetical protein
MSCTTIFLDKYKDDSIIRIHFSDDVEFFDSQDDIVNELIDKGVEIIAYSSKFNPYKNQKSEIMLGEKNSAEREATKFEIIANRLDTARGRLVNITIQVGAAANALDGSGSDPLEKKTELKDSPGNSIISGLFILLNELEDQINILENEQSRLSKIFF